MVKRILLGLCMLTIGGLAGAVSPGTLSISEGDSNPSYRLPQCSDQSPRQC